MQKRMAVSEYQSQRETRGEYLGVGTEDGGRPIIEIRIKGHYLTLDISAQDYARVMAIETGTTEEEHLKWLATHQALVSGDVPLDVQ